MKPAWDKLMEEFDGSQTALIADVDCTAEGQDLCSKHEVNGYPTIKYGSPDDLQDYNGGRDFEALKEFAQQNLGPSCGPAHVELCDAATHKTLTELLKMELGQLDSIWEGAKQKIADAQAKAKREWTVTVKRPEGTSLGMKLAPAAQGDHFKISALIDGAVQTYNAANPDDAIRVGDKVVKVNTATTTDGMQKEFPNNPVDISILRELSTEEHNTVVKTSEIRLIESVKGHLLATRFKITDDVEL